MPKVLFIIKMTDLEMGGCKQGNYLAKAGQVAEEREFLFSAYSAFQVISVKSLHDDDLEDPSEIEGIDYEITIKACSDNKLVSDDVPTAPWH